MAKFVSAGSFYNGSGQLDVVDYTEEFGQLHNDIADGLSNLQESMDENLLVMKEISRQLDVLTELVGEISEKLGAGI